MRITIKLNYQLGLKPRQQTPRKTSPDDLNSCYLNYFAITSTLSTCAIWSNYTKLLIGRNSVGRTEIYLHMLRCFCPLNSLFCVVLVAVAVGVASVSYCRSWLINLEKEVSAFHKYHRFVSPLNGVGAGELGCPSIRGLFQVFKKWRAAKWKLKRERIIEARRLEREGTLFPQSLLLFSGYTPGGERCEVNCDAFERLG